MGNTCLNMADFEGIVEEAPVERRRYRKKCFNCGSLDHLVADCPSEGKLCFHCQSPDHLASECPTPASRECYVCGSTEHIRNACPQRPEPAPRGGGGRSRSKRVKRCYICGEDDHLVRECDQYDPELAAAKKSCHNCGQLGHIMSQCSEPERARDERP